MVINQKNLPIIITIIILVIMWIDIKVEIASIEISRALFWIDLIAGVILFIGVIFFIYRGIFENNSHSYHNENEANFLMAGFILILLVLSWLLLGLFYEKGYSDKAIIELIELHEQKEEVEMMLDIVAFKGKNLKREIIQQSLYEVCSDQNVPCEVREPYKEVLNLWGNKDSADGIAEFLRV